MFAEAYIKQSVVFFVYDGFHIICRIALSEPVYDRLFCREGLGSIMCARDLIEMLYYLAQLSELSVCDVGYIGSGRWNV